MSVEKIKLTLKITALVVCILAVNTMAYNDEMNAQAIKQVTR